MNTNCFTRPKKPFTCKRPNFDIVIPLVDINAPKLLTFDASTECHTTPDHIADLMASYVSAKQYQTVLEPHCGTGQLINALLKSGISYTNIVGIERHSKLVEFTKERFKQHQFLKINQGCIFEHWFDCFKPDKHDQYSGCDYVVCNPPFKQIIKHIDRVYSFLKVGGVAICLVPMSYKKIDHEVLEILPNDTFLHAKVNTKIIKITK